jgi:ubiquitin carboxyl-terminal hydrolase 25
VLGVLNFSPHGTLGINYNYDVPDEFVENAWREAIQCAWCEGGNRQQLSNVNNAFHCIVGLCGSKVLWKKWQQVKDGGMAPNHAYLTLGLPAKINDGMLITIFTMQVTFPLCSYYNIQVTCLCVWAVG